MLQKAGLNLAELRGSRHVTDQKPEQKYQALERGAISQDVYAPMDVLRPLPGLIDSVPR